jgi:hypothetical protein
LPMITHLQRLACTASEKLIDKNYCDIYVERRFKAPSRLTPRHDRPDAKEWIVFAVKALGNLC